MSERRHSYERLRAPPRALAQGVRDARWPYDANSHASKAADILAIDFAAMRHYFTTFNTILLLFKKMRLPIFRHYYQVSLAASFSYCRRLAMPMR